MQEDLRRGLRRPQGHRLHAAGSGSRRSRSGPSCSPPASRSSTPNASPYYGYGTYPNVYTALEIERLVNASRSDRRRDSAARGREPKSRRHHPLRRQPGRAHQQHCSRVCCMYSLKLAHLLKERTGAEVYNFYIDMRTPGKGFEEFYNSVARRASISSAARSPTSPAAGRRRRPADGAGRGHAARHGAQDPRGHGGARDRDRAAGAGRSRA